MQHAVIMAGGSGTRFWPLSRRHKPKQFLPIGQENSLIQETVLRLKSLIPEERIWIVTQAIQVPQLKQQLTQIPESNILIEPEGRDTSAAIALATLFCAHRDPDATLVVMPSDHIIQTQSQFQSDLKRAFDVCDQSIVTIGIPPTSPHIGYGYILRGKSLAPDLYAVERFVEKPNLEKAQEYFQSGQYYWNAGIFVFHQKTMLSAFEKLMPTFFLHLKTMQQAFGSPRFSEVLAQVYPKLQKISIDFGIMEHFSPIKVIHSHFSWDDVGSLSALIRYGMPSLENNVVYGDWIGVESEGLLIHSHDHLIATLGVQNLAIIHTEDATLVAPRDRLEDLKKLGEKLTQQKREDIL